MSVLSRKSEEHIVNKRTELIKAALVGAIFGSILLLPIYVPALRMSWVGGIHVIYLLSLWSIFGMIFGNAVSSSPIWGSVIFVATHSLMFFIERSMTFRFNRRKTLIVYAYIVGLIFALTIVFTSFLKSVAGSLIN